GCVFEPVHTTMNRCICFPELRKCVFCVYESVHAMLEPVHRLQDVFYKNMENV
ncbi:hypothetical protein L195_g041100, partial [Trifolium pratense]